MHSNCALTYAEKETRCNYQQTTNYHQLHMAISPLGWKIKIIFVSDLFLFFVCVCVSLPFLTLMMFLSWRDFNHTKLLWPCH